MCKYLDTSFMLRATNSLRYKDLFEKVIERWRDIDIETVSLSYSFANYSNILLQNDDDLDILISNAIDERMKFIEVLVKCVSCGQNDVAMICDSDVGFSGVNNSNQHVKEEVLALEYDTREGETPRKIYLSEPWKTLLREVGQGFQGGVDHFRNDLCKYSIENGFQFVYERNEKDRVIVVCKHKTSKSCAWRIRACLKKANGFFYIREFNDVHSCGANVRKMSNGRMSSDIVASEILDLVRSNPIISAISIKKKFKGDYGLEISYDHAWLGLEKAKNIVYGDHTNSFNQLVWYIEKTIELNPGSHVVMEIDQCTKRFKRTFFAFQACIEGFNYMRPLLFLDGTFLKGHYQGTLLAAIGKDTEKGMFPLAFAVVASEDTLNWVWFMEQLLVILSPTRNMTFVSDRQKGLLEAVRTVFPSAHHSFCLRHLKANFKDKLGGKDKEFKDKMLSKIQLCAIAKSKRHCDFLIREIRKESTSKMNAFLDEAPLKHWANAYFEGNRYGELTSNMVESFNSWIHLARNLPIMNMVDTIRGQIMELFSKNRKESENWTSTLTPNCDKMILEAIEESRSWCVAESTNTLYEVKCHPSVFVDLRRKTCSCCAWQYKGFPCSHAICVIRSIESDIACYVEHYYHSEFYRLAYAKGIHPIPTIALEEPQIERDEVGVLPPTTKRPIGRPRKKRIISHNEKKGKMRSIFCSRCNVYGHHNRATCKDPI